LRDPFKLAQAGRHLDQVAAEDVQVMDMPVLRLEEAVSEGGKHDRGPGRRAQEPVPAVEDSQAIQLIGRNAVLGEGSHGPLFTGNPPLRSRWSCTVCMIHVSL